MDGSEDEESVIFQLPYCNLPLLKMLILGSPNIENIISTASNDNISPSLPIAKVSKHINEESKYKSDGSLSIKRSIKENKYFKEKLNKKLKRNWPNGFSKYWPSDLQTIDSYFVPKQKIIASPDVKGETFTQSFRSNKTISSSDGESTKAGDFVDNEQPNKFYSMLHDYKSLTSEKSLLRSPSNKSYNKSIKNKSKPEFDSNKNKFVPEVCTYKHKNFTKSPQNRHRKLSSSSRSGSYDSNYSCTETNEGEHINHRFNRSKYLYDRPSSSSKLNNRDSEYYKPIKDSTNNIYDSCGGRFDDRLSSEDVKSHKPSYSSGTIICKKDASKFNETGKDKRKHIADTLKSKSSSTNYKSKEYYESNRSRPEKLKPISTNDSIKFHKELSSSGSLNKDFPKYSDDHSAQIDVLEDTKSTYITYNSCSDSEEEAVKPDSSEENSDDYSNRFPRLQGIGSVLKIIKSREKKVGQLEVNENSLQKNENVSVSLFHKKKNNQTAKTSESIAPEITTIDSIKSPNCYNAAKETTDTSKSDEGNTSNETACNKNQFSCIEDNLLKMVPVSQSCIPEDKILKDNGYFHNSEENKNSQRKEISLKSLPNATEELLETRVNKDIHQIIEDYHSDDHSEQIDILLDSKPTYITYNSGSDSEEEAVKPASSEENSDDDDDYSNKFRPLQGIGSLLDIFKSSQKKVGQLEVNGNSLQKNENVSVSLSHKKKYNQTAKTSESIAPEITTIDSIKSPNCYNAAKETTDTSKNDEGNTSNEIAFNKNQFPCIEDNLLKMVPVSQSCIPEDKILEDNGYFHNSEENKNSQRKEISLKSLPNATEELLETRVNKDIHQIIEDYHSDDHSAQIDILLDSKPTYITYNSGSDSEEEAVKPASSEENSDDDDDYSNKFRPLQGIGSLLDIFKSSQKKVGQLEVNLNSLQKNENVSVSLSHKKKYNQTAKTSESIAPEITTIDSIKSPNSYNAAKETTDTSKNDEGNTSNEIACNKNQFSCIEDNLLKVVPDSQSCIPEDKILEDNEYFHNSEENKNSQRKEISLKSLPNATEELLETCELSNSISVSKVNPEYVDCHSAQTEISVISSSIHFNENKLNSEVASEGHISLERDFNNDCSKKFNRPTPKLDNFTMHKSKEEKVCQSKYIKSCEKVNDSISDNGDGHKTGVLVKNNLSQNIKSDAVKSQNFSITAKNSIDLTKMRKKTSFIPITHDKDNIGCKISSFGVKNSVTNKNNFERNNTVKRKPCDLLSNTVMPKKYTQILNSPKGLCEKESQNCSETAISTKHARIKKKSSVPHCNIENTLKHSKDSSLNKFKESLARKDKPLNLGKSEKNRQLSKREPPKVNIKKSLPNIEKHSIGIHGKLPIASLKNKDLSMQSANHSEVTVFAEKKKLDVKIGDPKKVDKYSNTKSKKCIPISKQDSKFSNTREVNKSDSKGLEPEKSEQEPRNCSNAASKPISRAKTKKEDCLELSSLRNDDSFGSIEDSLLKKISAPLSKKRKFDQTKSRPNEHSVFPKAEKSKKNYVNKNLNLENNQVTLHCSNAVANCVSPASVKTVYATNVPNLCNSENHSLKKTKDSRNCNDKLDKPLESNLGSQLCRTNAIMDNKGDKNCPEQPLSKFTHVAAPNCSSDSVSLAHVTTKESDISGTLKPLAVDVENVFGYSEIHGNDTLNTYMPIDNSKISNHAGSDFMPENYITEVNLENKQFDKLKTNEDCSSDSDSSDEQSSKKLMAFDKVMNLVNNKPIKSINCILSSGTDCDMKDIDSNSKQMIQTSFAAKDACNTQSILFNDINSVRGKLGLGSKYKDNSLKNSVALKSPDISNVSKPFLESSVEQRGLKKDSNSLLVNSSKKSGEVEKSSHLISVSGKKVISSNKKNKYKRILSDVERDSSVIKKKLKTSKNCHNYIGSSIEEEMEAEVSNVVTRAEPFIIPISNKKVEIKNKKSPMRNKMTTNSELKVKLKKTNNTWKKVKENMPRHSIYRIDFEENENTEFVDLDYLIATDREKNLDVHEVIPIEVNWAEKAKKNVNFPVTAAQHFLSLYAKNYNSDKICTEFEKLCEDFGIENVEKGTENNLEMLNRNIRRFSIVLSSKRGWCAVTNVEKHVMDYYDIPLCEFLKATGTKPTNNNTI